ncbi:hypothetical protein GCM10023322_83910 [Rugosimonospora acidiphila]|uniref:Uncharacterized protein n=1 Tax=Rugosimonospora acidiphila TaxID=556531 RepID=A0ABP9SW07_9ACTN
MKRPFALVVAYLAGALWVIDLTMVQPLTEPAKPWHHLTVGNNAYWARDLRWLAIFAAIAALLPVSRWAWTLAPFWIAADVILDRFDVRATGPVMVATAVAVTAFAVTARTGRGAARPGAVIAAALVPLAAEIQSPTDSEAALDPMAAAVAAVLLLAAIVGVVAVRTASPRTVLIVAGLTAGCGALIAWSRVEPPGARPIPILLGVLLTAAVVALTATRRHTVQTVMSALAYPASAIIAVLLCVLLSVGGIFTALAGNPPVHGGDEDAIVTLGGLAAGLLVTWTAWVCERPAGAVRASFETFERSMDRRFRA